MIRLPCGQADARVRSQDGRPLFPGSSPRIPRGRLALLALCREDFLLTRLLLFGAPGLVRGADDAEVLSLQPKRAAVLTYLAVARPGPLHRRDSLLLMFWPDHDAERGRNALSKVIHHLRRSLPPGAIVTQDDQVGIAHDQLWCDVTEFERALDNRRAEDALALYRGDFLQGFHIPGSPDFDHWSDVERGRLRRMAVASAWELAADAERDGDGARATRFARMAVEWAPRDESGFRRFLTLLQSRGNRAEALEAFDVFARELQRDYGVAPSGPTRELVEAIRDGRLPSDLAEQVPIASVPTSLAPDSKRLGPSPADGAGRPAAQPDPPMRVSEAPPHDAGPGRRFVAGAIACGLIGLIALSLLRGAPAPVTGDGAQRPAVLVTEFGDGTGEGLGAVVSEALRIDLAQSRTLDVVDRVDIVATLELMGLESNAPISAEVGRDVAVRDGLEVIVDGTVSHAGTGYLLTAVIREGGDGRTIASFRESVTAPDQMIPAIDALSLHVREALGERLGTIQESLPLERVTTPSLEALTLYTRAKTSFNEFDDRVEAASLLRRAVALDPGFAMAWRMLAVAYQNDADQTLRLEAGRQAYQHRDRLSEVERYLVEASYYAGEGRDRGRAIEVLLRVLDVNPEHGIALNNLGIQYLFMNDPAGAEELFQRSVETSRASSTTYRNLVATRLYLGRIEEAAQALGELEQKYPDYDLIPDLRARTLFQAGAVDEAGAEAQRIVDDPLWPATRRADSRAFLARVAYWEGRLEDARSGLLEAERLDGRNDEGAVWARQVESGYTAALVGDVAWARSHVENGLVVGLSENVVLNTSVQDNFAEWLALTSEVEASYILRSDVTGASSLGVAHARIQAGDTAGLRDVIDELPMHLFQRVLLFDRLGDTDRAIELYERVLQPGYVLWGDPLQLLRASMRLGPLYEDAGDTQRAIDAYTTFSERWAGGDRDGRAVAEGFAARARALQDSVNLPF